MPIYNYLDLSTAHLPQAEMEGIDLAPVITRNNTEWGVWVHVDINPENPAVPATEAQWASFPVLRQVIDYARTKGCHWINFDRDADIEDALITFEW